VIAISTEYKQCIDEFADKTFASGTQIWAYGSRIKGTSHDASDLDLVIKTDKKSPESIDNLVSFKALLQNSNIPILIQVLDWHFIPKTFKQNILQDYQVLHTVR